MCLERAKQSMRELGRLSGQGILGDGLDVLTQPRICGASL